MKMGTREGNLIYTAYGYKVNGIHQLPKILMDEILHRIPLYKNAPNCYLDKPNEMR
jgi:hypothetical protein